MWDLYDYSQSDNFQRSGQWPLVWEKEKKSTTQYRSFKHKICFVSKCWCDEKKKYFAFFWDLPQIVIKKLWYTYELEVSSSLHTTDDLLKSVNGTISKLQMKWIPWLQQAICIGKERYCNWDVMTGAQWEDCHTTKMLHNKIVVLI